MSSTICVHKGCASTKFGSIISWVWLYEKTNINKTMDEETFFMIDKFKIMAQYNFEPLLN
jgi:hypothetical protein